ncbi:MAG: 2-aminoadipate transaminase, partial [Mariniflexile sp.]
VVFVTGRTFDPASKKDDRLRLSFSNMPKESIEKGALILAKAVKKVLNNSKVKSS